MSPVNELDQPARRRRWRLAGAGVILAAATVSLSGLAGLGAENAPAAPDTTSTAIETATVSRGDLRTEDDFTGTVGYGDQWALALEPGGIVTAHPAAGTTVEFGEELVRIGEQPLILAEGEVPMYRELARTSPKMEGADVEQLQRFLLDQGFDDDGRLEIDGVFGYSTESAVEDWQESLGVEETGRVDITQLVFSPVPLRIAADARVGSAFAGLEVTEAAAIVTVDTDGQDRDLLRVGNPVSVELAEGSEMRGVVSEQERVLLDDGSAVWRSTIELDDSPPTDASNVVVHSTVTVEEDVMSVPVSALLALAEGGFAVEVVDGASTRLVAVEVGTVIGGLAEISGDVAAGDEVVVPS